MQVDYYTAQKVFEQFPNNLKSSYLHPFYVKTDALRDCTLRPVFWIYKESGEMFYYSFHLGRVPGTGCSDIQSAYSYGGPLASTMNQEFLAAAWQHYLLWCQANQVLAEFIRFHPLIHNHHYFLGDIHHLRQTVWVDLCQANPLLVYLPRTRTSVRKAYKHDLRVEWVNPGGSYPLFYELYTQTMDRIQADKFYYFPLEYFHNLSQWEHCYMAFCFKNHKLLAAAMFLKTDTVMEYHLAANTPEGNQCCASSFILDQAVNLAMQLGCTRLHLGGGTDNRPDNPLFIFKSGFSHERADYYIAKIIHDSEGYYQLKERLLDKYEESSDKLLFYRFLPIDEMREL